MNGLAHARWRSRWTTIVLGLLACSTPGPSGSPVSISYYPHLPYEVLTRSGELVRRVRNHRGENDEDPTRLSLAPGTYLIRAETAQRVPAEFFITVEADEATTVYVEELLQQ